MPKLTLRAPSPIPLEVEGITPERVAGLSLLEVAKLPVQHGNRREELGQFFDVTAGPVVPGTDLHFAGDTRNVKHIGAGMSAGFVFVENTVGMHTGAGMSGGRLVIDGGAGDWLGAEMRGGSIEVRGNAGGQIGAGYRGSRRGMRDGTILVRGSAGDEVGLRMRRGMIVVEGDCGEFAGSAMIAGTLVLLGDIGGRAGAGMKRGTLLTVREPVLPPSFAFACTYRPPFLLLSIQELRRLGVALPDWFTGTVRCYRGDLLTGSLGEVLVAQNG